MPSFRSRERAVLVHMPTNPPIDIEFKDITFSVSQGIGKIKKQILKSVSGTFLSGELTAVMGPSGAGKSSLLNILSGFQTTGVGGTIRTNSIQSYKADTTREYRKESCYILQDDQLAPLFTVNEIINMATDLKLGKSISEKAKKLLIDDILESLGLTICQETRCGNLSGGQKKRLSIALELVDNPPVMFLDEPTTGLDSSSSLQCIKMLKALARGGRTIICTIHQPCATIYEQFDHVYVLAEGNCVYQGASSNTVNYLSSNGMICPRYHNPADYLLEVVNKEYGDYTEVLTQNANDSSWRKVHISSIEQKHEEKKSYNGNHVNSKKSVILVSEPSEWTRFRVLFNRSIIQLYRDWTVTHLKLLMHFVVGVTLGVMFLNAGNDGSKTISNFGFLQCTGVYLCYTSMIPAVLRFPSELSILKKERFNNWYSLKTYYLAFLAADIPVQLMLCIVYVSVSYFLSAQPQDLTRFLMFLMICILTTLTFQSVGLLLGTTVSPVNGTFLGSIAMAIMLVFSGFLILFNHMPRYLYWLSYFSYFRYGLEGLVLSVYGYGRADLDCPEEANYCHHKKPQILLQEIGMATDRYWFDCGVLFVNLIMLRIVTFISLRRKLSSS